MEKSLSELFKWFEKQEVIEGYLTNEEELEKRVEDYTGKKKKKMERKARDTKC